MSRHRRAVRFAAFQAVFLLLAASAWAAEGESGLTGTVVTGGKPVAGVQVHAYTDASRGFLGPGAAVSEPTGSDGRYRFDLPAGTYYIIVKEARTGEEFSDPLPGERHGYYGANPVPVPQGGHDVRNLQVVQRREIERVPLDGGVPGGRLEGVVLGPDGRPVSGASLHIYADVTRDFRGPDIFGPMGALPQGTGEDGRFSLSLPAGWFFVLGARRASGLPLGPVQEGDLFGYFDGNPLKVEAGSRVGITLQLIERLTPKQRPRDSTAGLTGISGVIRDGEGKPVAGVFAFAVRDAKATFGIMPKYRSAPTGDDGRYRINLPAGGAWFVTARSRMAGPPSPGEWLGFYGGSAGATVEVQGGVTVEGIDLTVQRVQ